MSLSTYLTQKVIASSRRCVGTRLAHRPVAKLSVQLSPNTGKVIEVPLSWAGPPLPKRTRSRLSSHRGVRRFGETVDPLRPRFCLHGSRWWWRSRGMGRGRSLWVVLN